MRGQERSSVDGPYLKYDPEQHLGMSKCAEDQQSGGGGLQIRKERKQTAWAPKRGAGRSYIEQCIASSTYLCFVMRFSHPQVLQTMGYIMLFGASFLPVLAFKELPAAGSCHDPNDKSEPGGLMSDASLLQSTSAAEWTWWSMQYKKKRHSVNKKDIIWKKIVPLRSHGSGIFGAKTMKNCDICSSARDLAAANVSLPVMWSGVYGVIIRLQSKEWKTSFLRHWWYTWKVGYQCWEIE